MKIKMLYYRATFRVGRANEKECRFIKSLRLEDQDSHYLFNNFPKFALNEWLEILPLKEISEEMENLTPGCELKNWGYYPLARSYSGSLYCVNGKYRDGSGLVRVSRFYPGPKSDFASEEMIEERSEMVCYGIQEFHRRCFTDEDIG